MINLGYWDQFDGGVKFSAYKDEGDTLTGTLYLVFDNVVINNGNGYDSENGVFRAPSNGIYSFQFSGQQSSTTAGFVSTIYIMENRARIIYISDTALNYELGGYQNINYLWELELKEGDEINLILSGGDNLYADSVHRLYFSGQLISLTQ